MRFLIDAQLPLRLARWLRAEGHDAIHTMDLPDGNRTADAEINSLSLRDRRIVITKDEDFVDSFLLRNEPHKLCLVATGNIGNRELESLMRENLERVVSALDEYDFVELDRTSLICHR
jgi:predicted nuclease of predicted toxin-antitoxin system